MGRSITCLFALCALAFPPGFFGQQTDAATSARLNATRERAQGGEAEAQFELGFAYDNGLGVEKSAQEAILWYKKAADQGNVSARFSLGDMYFEGRGVTRDYDEAARWYRCGKPAADALGACEAVAYKDLPAPVATLLKQMHCQVGPGDNYDYGSAVDLNGDGTLEYEFCCREAPHGPCGAVLIGRIGSEWKDLGAGLPLQGYGKPCGLFVVLESRQAGYHDICLPNQCSSADAKACSPTIWQFRGGSYHTAGYSPVRQAK